MSTIADDFGDRRADGLVAGGEVAELTLLLLRDHLVALERMADAEGITAARLLRKVIRDYPASRPIESDLTATKDRPAEEGRHMTSAPQLPLKVVPGNAHPVLARQLAPNSGNLWPA